VVKWDFLIGYLTASARLRMPNGSESAKRDMRNMTEPNPDARGLHTDVPRSTHRIDGTKSTEYHSVSIMVFSTESQLANTILHTPEDIVPNLFLDTNSHYACTTGCRSK
jgi:hypothetical protein